LPKKIARHIDVVPMEDIRSYDEKYGAHNRMGTFSRNRSKARHWIDLEPKTQATPASGDIPDRTVSKQIKVPARNP
jgi:hypothetical protein